MTSSELHRRAVRVARTTYLAIERTPLAPLLRSQAVQWLKARITYMPAVKVLALLDLIAAEAIQVYVAGGWGVDALAGRQTRQHYDLDLLIDADPVQVARAGDVLEREGFRKAGTEHNPGLPMPWRHLWRHDDGYSVEVLPAPLADPPFGDTPCTLGTIEGRPVPCLSVALQLALHTGYPPRSLDAADTDLLNRVSAR
jgi:lincosamide nucleotidyltransferase A/C/D/E